MMLFGDAKEMTDSIVQKLRLGLDLNTKKLPLRKFLS